MYMKMYAINRYYKNYFLTMYNCSFCTLVQKNFNTCEYITDIKWVFIRIFYVNDNIKFKQICFLKNKI